MSNLHIEENVGVHTVAGRTLYVDIFHPENSPAPVPSLLFLPGGGWRTADRAPLKERFGMRMAEHGYLFVAGEYRVMDEAPWPAQIQDVKAIIRWLRVHHERLGIDPAAIVIVASHRVGTWPCLPLVPEGLTRLKRVVIIQRSAVKSQRPLAWPRSPTSPSGPGGLGWHPCLVTTHQTM